MVAGHVPTVLAERRRLHREAPGCYRVDTGAGAFSFLWIAANELPLRLSDKERRSLHDRLVRLGPERLGDVVLDLAAEQLAVWLGDPDAR